MGTRSTVKFYGDFDVETPILSVYQQRDGYVSGVGHELAQFLIKKEVINGISGSDSLETNKANGMGCLAAQYVKEQKTRVGGFYLTTPDDEQEYNYKVVPGKKIVFKGKEYTPEEFLNYKEE